MEKNPRNRFNHAGELGDEFEKMYQQPHSSSDIISDDNKDGNIPKSGRSDVIEQFGYGSSTSEGIDRQQLLQTLLSIIRFSKGYNDNHQQETTSTTKNNKSNNKFRRHGGRDDGSSSHCNAEVDEQEMDEAQKLLKEILL